jgi:hypothetical protein
MTTPFVFTKDGVFRFDPDSDVADQIAALHELCHDSGMCDEEIAAAVREYLATLAVQYRSQLN